MFDSPEVCRRPVGAGIYAGKADVERKRQLYHQMLLSMKVFSLLSVLAPVFFPATTVSAQTIVDGNGTIPDDLNGSNFTYPWPIKLYKFTSQRQPLEMAFMDVRPQSAPNGKVAALFHGKNFCAATWEGTARTLVSAGFRVIIPDQIGFCKSSKPERYQFTLQQFALNTYGLLQALSIENVTVIGHSMGGMLATRYSLMYPGSVNELALVNPIGLEDWKALGVPYQSIDVSWGQEANSSYESVRAYQQSTYYVGQWVPKYDVWVKMLVDIYKGSQSAPFIFNQAQTTDMVLTQPIVYEFGLLKPRTLLINGKKDTTAIGKQWSPPDVAAKLGHYDVLGKGTVAKIPNGTLIEFDDLGHAPQIQDSERFYAALMGWLTK
ncbi:alpha/beta-hydrolase [Zopfia rhizophila CBS 207.26]|uniref:Alpha/beta-hydrolase n=1 Tax=Zopfia rhizophila CBS 207.26 TaxID=1314779 RepID=A0A6A6EHI2_9PEZI|nr:alpha/beta-hydrolase [Zopfia rhizophila CBS 207.26]